METLQRSAMFIALDRLRWSPLRQECAIRLRVPAAWWEHGAPLERDGIATCSQAINIWLLPEPVPL